MSAAKALGSDTVPRPIAAETRSSEPSMEDILASIRRIIADDQSRHDVAAPPPPRAAFAPPPRPAPPSALPSSGGTAGPVTPVAGRPAVPAATASNLPAPRITAEPLKTAPMTPHINPPPLSAPRPAEPVAAQAPPSVLPKLPAMVPPLQLAVPLASAATSSPALLPAQASVETVPALLRADKPAPTPSPNQESVPTPLAAPPQGEPPAQPERTAEVDAAASPPAAEPLVSSEAMATIETSFHSLATSVFLQNSGMIEGLVRDMLRPMLKNWLDDNLPAVVERLVRVEIERVARGRS